MKHFLFKITLTFVFFIFIFQISNYAQENSVSKFEKVADNLNFPEGPAWNGKNLFVSSCYDGKIIKISTDSYSVFADSANNKPLKQTNGLAFDKNGNLFACDYGIGAILKISPEGKVEIYCKGFNGKKFNRPNDLAFDREGNLYFTDPNSEKPDGFVYRIDAKTKEVKLIAESLAFPNGIAFSKDYKNLFICESAKNRILKYDVDEKGNLKNKTTFVDLPGGEPDGIAFDVKGNLYAAHFGGGQIYIISPDGNIKDSIKAPGKETSNVEFGGEDLKTLFITEDETNSVYKIKTEFSGLKLFGMP